jgi:hypothetical protein
MKEFGFDILDQHDAIGRVIITWVRRERISNRDFTTSTSCRPGLPFLSASALSSELPTLVTRHGCSRRSFIFRHPIASSNAHGYPASRDHAHAHAEG